jgi:predicted nuclease of restriction endonuclease-like (RecB) superfamily
VTEKQPDSDSRDLQTPEGYEEFLRGLKQRIRQARLKAMLAVNRELILFYWSLGRDILERQSLAGWGSKIVDRLSKDLHRDFPDIKGFSRTNLLYMRACAEAWPEESLVQQVVGQIPWGHNIRILDMVKVPAERLWYIEQAVQNGWSRNVLVIQIESDLYHRQGKAVTNFEQTLPATQSDLARQILKDPYNFDFLTLSTQAHERDMERGLLDHLRQFLLELGQGFAFVGSQYPLEVGGEDFRLDLLFYHLRLRCYVVIDLKMGKFKPEYAGKMNFYLSAVDDRLRHADDQPTIGIIMCKSHNEILVEYALRHGRPMGVAEFLHGTTLPEEFQRTLPTVEELEAELTKENEQ